MICDCDSSIAYESPDHLCPHGTRQDNSTNPRFVEKLLSLAMCNGKTRLRILDLGCAGGQFVKDCLDVGMEAYGLEGSDYSQKRQRGVWGSIPSRLATCDITKRFVLKDGDEPIKFEVITLWEVVEHIAEHDLQQLSKNLLENLSEDGIVVMSVANHEDIVNGYRLHQTLQPKEWWIDTFLRYGLLHREEYVRYFGGQFVRGRHEGKTFFHLVLVKSKDAMEIPSRGISERLLDLWFGSLPHKIVRRLVR